MFGQHISPAKQLSMPLVVDQVAVYALLTISTAVGAGTPGACVDT